ncbi:hypothetical protein [Sinorhizobium psoraleae]|uniref:Uncharacterized protein n=1 Tax=Sinorhizobium psoraleae TaxID=520838 RepID=A0ABT4KDC6_9HYPH|nr:hypothetical protein [Sinorhizobium psoraleae]MCZ4089371.1 hypothetical protein [Sinorhizobium psoraleae]
MTLDERVDKPEMVENRPEWIWYCESKSGVPVVTFGRWPKHPQQARYKLAEIQPTEHDHPTSGTFESDPQTLRNYCCQLLDMLENYGVEIDGEDNDLISHISKAVDPANAGERARP